VASGNARPAPSVNYSFKIVFATTGVPQVFPSLRIAPGWAVSVRGNNGTTGGNANAIYVARKRSALLLPTQTETVTPDTEISFPVDNVGQIWAVGTAGDGAIVSVRYGIA
jgi:SH3-like domain-containing protein